MKLMLTKLNQKCRDSGRSVIKQTLKQVPEGHVHESRPMWGDCRGSRWIIISHKLHLKH